jgi:hypothetical protein
MESHTSNVFYTVCYFIIFNLYYQVVKSPSLDSLSSIELTHLPLEVQISVHHLVSCLHSLFVQLEIREDIYSIGHLSGLVASQLEILPDACSRRKVSILVSAYAVDFYLKCKSLRLFESN